MEERFDVWLVSFDPLHGSPVEGLVRVFGVGVAQAQHLLGSLPHVVKHDVSRAEADRMRAALEGIGAHVEVHLARPRPRAAAGAPEPAGATKTASPRTDLSVSAITKADLDLGGERAPSSSLPAPSAGERAEAAVPKAPAIPRALHESHLARLEVDSVPDSVAGAFAPSSTWRPPAEASMPDPVVVPPRRSSVGPPMPTSGASVPGSTLRGAAPRALAGDDDQKDLAIALGLFVLGLALLGIGLLRRDSVFQGEAGVFGIARDGFAFWDVTYGLSLLVEVWRRTRGAS